MIGTSNDRFMSNRKIYWLAAITVIAIGMIVCILAGVRNYESLSGGSKVVFSFKNTISRSDIVSDSSNIPGETEVSSVAQEKLGYPVSLTMNEEKSLIVICISDSDTVPVENINTFCSELALRYPDYTFSLKSAYSFDKPSGNSLLYQCIAAASTAFLLLSFYISLKYKKINFWAVFVSCSTALLIDCFVGFLSVVCFGLPLDENIFAIIIAVMGCSVNAEITVFDSIRENKKFFGDSVSYADVGNRSITESYRRVISSNACMIAAALIAAILSAVYGVTAVAILCLPIIFSLISCSFTSLFIASSIWVTWLEKSKKS